MSGQSVNELGLGSEQYAGPAEMGDLPAQRGGGRDLPQPGRAIFQLPANDCVCGENPDREAHL